MPEHDFDSRIDRAFADLLEDVGGRTNPPPASSVIERARRRRTTTFAAAAAVVLIVGAAAVASGVGRPSAAPGPAGQLPAPHVLDQDAWSAATEGWIGDWGPLTEDSTRGWMNKLQDPKCLGAMSDTGPEPDRSGALTLVSSSHAVVFGAFADFDDPTKAQSTWRVIGGAVSDCPEATLLHQGTWDGAEASSYRLAGNDGDDYVWVAHQGQAMGLVWVAGDTAPLPESTDARVMTALMSGLQDPGSFKGLDDTVTDSGSGSSTAVPNASLDDGEFARALGTWDSGWQRASAKSIDNSLPCLSDSDLTGSAGSMGGFGSSVGTNGSYSASWFGDDQTASQAFDGLVDQLRACRTPYAVDLVGSEPQVAVISSDQGVAWMVRQGTSIGVVSIDGGHADPPAEVSTAVGAVIDRALRTTSP